MDNEKQPLVSVVIPTYNRINTLPAAIYSVLNQTYENMELIIMDDGSEDGTEEYVKSISDKRVRYKRSDINLGPSAARNLGARIARGEYLAFQDSDDEWMPDKLEKQMGLMMESKELSLVYCVFEKYRDGELLGYVPSKSMPYEEKCGDLFIHLLLSPLISTQTIVVKRELFLEENGFNETLKSYEDWEFSLRFSRKHRIGFVDESLVRVNSSPDSVNKRFDERIRSQFYMIQEMMDTLRELDLLWKKLEDVLDEAESLLCHDTFIEEMNELSARILTDEELSNAQVLLQETERDKENIQFQMDVFERISQAKADILKIYTELYVNRTGWSAKQHDKISQMKDIVDDYRTQIALPEEIESSCARLYQSLERTDLQWTDQLFLLTDVVEVLEALEKLIS